MLYSTATTLKNGGNVLVPCCPSVSFEKNLKQWREIAAFVITSVSG